MTTPTKIYLMCFAINSLMQSTQGSEHVRMYGNSFRRLYQLYMNNNGGVKLGEQAASLFCHPVLSAPAPTPAAPATS